METVIVVKPDAVLRSHVLAATLNELAAQPGLEFVSAALCSLDVGVCARIYPEVIKASFYPWVVSYLSVCPAILLLAVCSPESLGQLRRWLGTAPVEKSPPGTLRQRFGICFGISCAHVADDLHLAAAELRTWKEIAHFPAGRSGQAQLTALTRCDVTGPDGTPALREICGDIGRAGGVEPRQGEQIREVLDFECRGASGHVLDAFTSVIASGALWTGLLESRLGR